MANTWQGSVAAWLPSSFSASVEEDPAYSLNRSTDSIAYRVDLGDGRSLSLPVTASMGGRRHGLGFLVSLNAVDGIPLARRVMVQARYAWSPERSKLLIAPGCPINKSTSLESTLGLALSPTFEARCLSCHGQPNAEGSGSNGGVHCEACHGAGSEHLTALANRNASKGIVNPKHLSSEQSIAICAGCHVGIAKFSDSSAGDLLVANQVLAIQRSECFIQSRKVFSCTTCHDPHNDAVSADKLATTACLSCHSSQIVSHAAICPVNNKSNCISCHMPSVDKGALHLVDHLIRVHPEQGNIKNLPIAAETKSQIEPISEYLRIITTNSSAVSAAARRRLDSGESFYSVARELSADRSAEIGGYLGLKVLSELPKDLSVTAGRLSYGETSQPTQSNEQWFILQRLPRDFRFQAEQLQDQAEDLANHGDPQSAIRKSQEALMVYPQFLRALVFIGTTFTKNGNPKKGAEVISTATHLYPDDAGAEFALAASLNLLGDQAKAIDAYRRAILLEPDFTAAYSNLGMLQYSSGDLHSAINTFNQGLQIDPLSAELSYDLSLAFTRSGDNVAGAKAITLARKLDGALVKQREAEK